MRHPAIAYLGWSILMLVSACSAQGSFNGFDEGAENAGTSNVGVTGGSAGDAFGTAGNFATGGNPGVGGFGSSGSPATGGFATYGGAGGTVTSFGGMGGALPGGNGLSCEMDRILTANCLGCHGVQPALKPLATRADLLAMSAEMPSMRVIDVVLARMQSAALPMPPSPLPKVSSADIALVAQWVSSGTPSDSCSSGTGGGSSMGGSSMGGSSTGGAPTLVCTSGVTYKSGTGSDMRPGEDCKSCHGGDTIAGTVYPTEHELKDCDGINGTTDGVQVILTGADGKKVTFTPSKVGNFHSGTKIATPYTVLLTRGTATRAMLTPQTAGNCNSCHTPTGANNAPGRIMAP